MTALNDLRDCDASTGDPGRTAYALQIAGLRLDSAKAHMTSICCNSMPIDEVAFGAAETREREARADYEAMLEQASGQRAADILRRLA